MLDSEDMALEDLLITFSICSSCLLFARVLVSIIFFLFCESVIYFRNSVNRRRAILSDERRPAIGAGGSSYPSPIVSVQKLSALVTPHVLRMLYN